MADDKTVLRARAVAVLASYLVTLALWLSLSNPFSDSAMLVALAVGFFLRYLFVSVAALLFR
ncbi:MAG: hypothetical protein KAG82_01065 [Alcanivoracaceae bacterium]|jgi:hypothetical protein|nr:hypothetical protein [Alcanivoracaceae bacterium]